MSYSRFPRVSSLAAARVLPIHRIELEDKADEIGACFAAAKLAANSRLIFFKGFTELLADIY